jgi:hypothetical protein
MIKNFMLWTLLTLYIVFYFIGTAVAISNKNVGLTAMFFSGFAFIGGIHLGHWGAEKSQQRMTEIRERYSVRSA